MKKPYITVLYKAPGQKPEVKPLFENSLAAFQNAVGGYIESVTVTSDLVILCNEEGHINGIPFNVKFLNWDFYGPILLVGTSGEDFASFPMIFLPFVLNAMEEGGAHAQL